MSWEESPKAVEAAAEMYEVAKRHGLTVQETWDALQQVRSKTSALVSKKYRDIERTPIK